MLETVTVEPNYTRDTLKKSILQVRGLLFSHYLTNYTQMPLIMYHFRQKKVMWGQLKNYWLLSELEVCLDSNF